MSANLATSGTSWRVGVRCDLEKDDAADEAHGALTGLAALTLNAAAKAANRLPKAAVMVAEMHESVGG